jgi:hypothetical protein
LAHQPSILPSSMMPILMDLAPGMLTHYESNIEASLKST